MIGARSGYGLGRSICAFGYGGDGTTLVYLACYAGAVVSSPVGVGAVVPSPAASGCVVGSPSVAGAVVPSPSASGRALTCCM